MKTDRLKTKQINKLTARQTKKHNMRQKILLAAAGQLKARGFRETSVASVMDQVGLTHGSFYSYFKNKDHMIIEATNCAIELSNEKIQSHLVNLTDCAERIKKFIEFYLSDQHRDAPIDGCPVVALSRDFSLASKKLRIDFAKKLKQVIDHRRSLFAADKKEISSEEWIGLMSTYIGAMLLSRSCAGDPLSEKILSSSQKFILKSFLQEFTQEFSQMEVKK